MLGKGGFARCYELINDETKEVEAVKIIQKSSLTKARSKQKLVSEIKIHQSFLNDNIVEFRRHFEDYANVKIVLEICSNSFKQMVIISLEKEPHKRPASSELKRFEFFIGVSLSRQPSISFRAQSSFSIAKEEK